MDGIRSELDDFLFELIEGVREKKDAALLEFSDRFDGIKLSRDEIEVSREEWQEKAAGITEELRKVLSGSALNIKNYSEKQNIFNDYEIDNNGINIRDKFIPVESVGIYVPGGKYAYPSTVLMCAIPARVAGVEKIYMLTPPGNITPCVLAAAQIAGVDRIFRIGGAQAIAALAYGTETIPRVDKIVGPGNKYVQWAKLHLSGIVGIDMIAGPSEVVIIADKEQDPAWVATDLIAQAEHAEDAVGILITDSQQLLEEVKKLIPAGLYNRITFKKVEDLDEAVVESNRFAPEHLEVMCSEENIGNIEGKIRNAGAVFLGKNTPVAIGDYFAGPSHTLPTGRSARYEEGLNVKSFMKKVSFIRCAGSNLKEILQNVESFANEEGMKYHAESVRKRYEDGLDE
ncbi:MAG: histidinol dehydrogenase [Elusimicrobiota bacterium]